MLKESCLFNKNVLFFANVSYRKLRQVFIIVKLFLFRVGNMEKPGIWQFRPKKPEKPGILNKKPENT